MKYQWHEHKQRRNQQIHNVDFSAMEHFEWENAVIFADRRKDYKEARYVAFAPLDGRLHCVVFTTRGSDIRIISLRKANKREVNRYEATTENQSSHE